MEVEAEEKAYAAQRRAITEEIFGILQRTSQLSFELRDYAYSQHAMRELRAHTNTWAAELQAAAPSELRGRAGQEHVRTTASDMIEQQAHWPFHLAGDSGARLFQHRAWLTWRFLAMLELPSSTLSELPLLSKDLQALIEATRSGAETSDSLSAQTVQEVLTSFYHDPACNHIKGKWLRRALKLGLHAEDSEVETQLQQAVAHVFTVLQSLLGNKLADATLPLSPRFVACAALFLHLQDSHCTTALGAWQSLCVQERSARARTSTTRLKRYVTSEQLGEEMNSPLSQFPRCVEHLTSSLDPEVHAVATPPVLCWVCGAGFLSQQALFRHTRAAHGDYAEYRKHLFFAHKRKAFCRCSLGKNGTCARISLSFSASPSQRAELWSGASRRAPALRRGAKK